MGHTLLVEQRPSTASHGSLSQNFTTFSYVYQTSLYSFYASVEPMPTVCCAKCHHQNEICQFNRTLSINALSKSAANLACCDQRWELLKVHH